MTCGPRRVYEFAADPDAQHDLIADARFRGEVSGHREPTVDQLRATGDPALEAFVRLGDPAARDAFLEQEDELAKAHAAAQRRALVAGR